jgi:hypothetical protein
MEDREYLQTSFNMASHCHGQIKDYAGDDFLYYNHIKAEEIEFFEEPTTIKLSLIPEYGTLKGETFKRYAKGSLESNEIGFMMTKRQARALAKYLLSISE